MKQADYDAFMAKLAKRRDQFHYAETEPPLWAACQRTGCVEAMRILQRENEELRRTVADLEGQVRQYQTATLLHDITAVNATLCRSEAIRGKAL